MTNPTFNASLINDLKGRVTSHNEANPSVLVKLAELKKLYVRGYHGPNPGAEAMNRVDAYLSGLEKAEFESYRHPRDQHGRFSGAAAEEIPENRGEHKQLQNTSAGYNALTSDAFPTHMNEWRGLLGREIGSAALAGGIVTTLSRSKNAGPHFKAAVDAVKEGRKTDAVREAGRFFTDNDTPVSLAERLARRSGRFTGSVAGTVAGGVLSAAAALAEKSKKTSQRGFNNIAGRVGVAMPLPKDHNWSGRIFRFVRNGGATLGEGAARVGVRSVSGVAGAGIDAFSNGFNHPGIVKAGIITAASIPLYVNIRNRVKESMLDPQTIGHDIDLGSYRQVQKSASSAELEKVRSGIMADIRKSSNSNVLNKVIPEGMIPTAGQFALSGIKAALGAGVGAGLGLYAAHKKGNPYHDKQGKFASRDKAGAAVGAVVGGAAVGATALLAYRRKNASLFLKAVNESYVALRNSLARIDRPQGYQQVKRFIDNKSDWIDEYIADKQAVSKKLKTELAQIDLHGAHPEEHYMNLAEKDITTRLVDLMRTDPGFTLPAGRNISSPLLPPNGANIQRFVEQATDVELLRVADGMRNVTNREAVRKLIASKSKMIADVRITVEAYHAKIDSVEKSIKDADSKLESHRDMRRSLEEQMNQITVGGGRIPKQLQDAHTKTIRDIDKATTEVWERTQALDDLKSGYPVVKNPVSGGPMANPPAGSVTDHRTQALNRFRKDSSHSAERDFKNEVARLRSIQREAVGQRSDRTTAALIVNGQRYGGAIPENAKSAANEVIKLSNELSVARREYAEASNTFAKAKIALNSATKNGTRKIDKAARDVFDKAIDDAQRAEEEAHGSMINAKMALNHAVLRTTVELNKPRSDMLRHLKRILPVSVVNDLKETWRKTTASNKTKLNEFLATPNGKRLHEFYLNRLASKKATTAAAKPPSTRQKAEVQANRMLVDAYHQLFTYPDSNPPYSPKFSPVKALRSATILGIGTEGIKEISQHALSYLQTPPEGGRKKAPKPFTIESQTDPLTGAGYVALTIKHPEGKGERAIILGEHVKETGGRVETSQLAAGSKLSTLKARIPEDRNPFGRGGTQNPRNLATAGWLGNREHGWVRDAIKSIGDKTINLGGYIFRSENHVDDKVGQTSGTFRKELAKRFMNNDAPDKGKFYDALRLGIFSAEGKILQAHQVYALLTGYNPDGTSNNHVLVDSNPLLDKDERFSSKNKTEVAEAFQKAFGPGSRAQPKDDSQREYARGVLEVVVHTKGLNDEQRKAIADVIGLTPTAGGQNQRPPWEDRQRRNPEATPRGNPTPGMAAPTEFDWSKNMDTPLGWGGAEVERLATKRSLGGGPQGFSSLADQLEFDKEAQPDEAERNVAATHLLTMVTNVIGHAYKDTNGNGLFKPFQAVRIAHEALVDAHKAGVNYADESDFPHIEEYIKTRADRELNKFVPIMLDNMEELYKAFAPQSNTTNHPGMTPPQVAAQPLQHEAPTPLITGSSRVKPDRPLSEPVRFGNELGGGLAGNAAWTIASKFIPGVAMGREAGIIGKAIAGVTYGAKQAGRGAAILGSSVAAGAVGGAVGNSAGKEVYVEQGKKAPSSYGGPNYTTPQEAVGDAAGNIGGMMVGRAAGAAAGGAIGLAAGPLAPIAVPTGEVVGGTLGGMAGGELGRLAGKYFSGYDHASISRVASKYGSRAT